MYVYMYMYVCIYICVWPFQEPKLEVPTVYKACVRECPHKIWPYMIQYLHFRVLKFPIIFNVLEYVMENMIAMFDYREGT